VNDTFTGLFIGTPAYLGDVKAPYCASLLQTTRKLDAAHLRWCMEFYTGPSAVQIARGVLVAKFMASSCSHLMFIDADLSWEPEAIQRLLSASAHHDVCCGVYPKKCDPLSFPVNFKLTANYQPISHEVTNYVSLDDACSGFLMIRRRAVEQLIEAYPERKCSFREEDSTPEAEGQYEYNLFEFLVDDCPRRMYLSEDFGFSRLYQRIGGEIWADPDIRLVHYGHKRYEGAIRDILIDAQAAV
jgi:hypothetical protein